MPTFSLKNDRLLEVTLMNEKVSALAGAMVAYEGQMKFEKLVLGGEGLFGALRRAVSNEGMPLMSTSGSGKVYFAHDAQTISILPLQNEKLFIESRNLLAFDQTLRTSTAFQGLRGGSGSGFFTTTVEGNGNVAVFSDGNLIRLEVSPQWGPLFVDPDAFIAYKGNIQQEFHFDVNWRTMIGQTSGESYQLKFTGNGVVFIQPSELKS